MMILIIFKQYNANVMCNVDTFNYDISMIIIIKYILIYTILGAQPLVNSSFACFTMKGALMKYQCIDDH